MNFESGRSETDAARVDWADTHYWGCIKWSVELTGAPATHGAPAPFCSCTAGTSVVPSCILIALISLGDCHRLWWRLMVPLRRVLEGAPILGCCAAHLGVMQLEQTQLHQAQSWCHMTSGKGAT